MKPEGLKFTLLGQGDNILLVMVASDIQRLVARLVQSGVRSVAVCQVVRRLKWRKASFEVGAARAHQLNSYLKAFSEDMPFVFFWRHKRLWSSTMSIFRGDGCHFNDARKYRLFRSIRGTIMAAARALL